MPWDKNRIIGIVAPDESDHAKNVVYEAATNIAQKVGARHYCYSNHARKGFHTLAGDANSTSLSDLDQYDRLIIVGHGDGVSHTLGGMASNDLAKYLKRHGLATIGLISLVSCSLGAVGLIGGFGNLLAINLPAEKILCGEIRVRSGPVTVGNDGRKHVFQNVHKKILFWNTTKRTEMAKGAQGRKLSFTPDAPTQDDDDL